MRSVGKSAPQPPPSRRGDALFPQILFVIFDTRRIQHFNIFFLDGFHLMVLYLISDLMLDLISLQRTDGERTITTLPAKHPIAEVVVYPF